MTYLLCFLLASLAGTRVAGISIDTVDEVPVNHKQANIGVNEALNHYSDIKYYNNASQMRYPPQMDEYDAALNMLIDVTPTILTDESLRDFRTSRAAAVCLPDDASCSPTDNCCQGGCSTSGECMCQANGAWCFNFGNDDSFCCSNVCGKNGKCECINEGKSCAVGSGYCCNGLTCDSETLTCTSEAHQPSSKKPTTNPTQAPFAKKMQSSKPTINNSSKDLESGCSNGERKVLVEIKTGEFLCWNMNCVASVLTK